MNFITKLRQAICSHRFVISQIVRRKDGTVECVCEKCGKLCVAEYGIVLPGNFIQEKKGTQ